MSSPYRLAVALVLVSFGWAPRLKADQHQEGERDGGAVAECGDLVRREGDRIVVLPNGSDDTANLACALRSAGGRTVRLRADKYRVSSVAVTNFQGRLQGAGRDSTVITHLSRPVYVTPLDFINHPPSSTNIWASILAFIGGTFTISDLSIKVTGVAPTTGWRVLGLPDPIYAYAHGIVIIGGRATAVVERIVMEGENAPKDLFGVNLVNGIFYEGLIGPEFLPIGGSFQVRDSVFRLIASPTPVFNISGATIEIENNLMDAVLLGGELYGGMSSSRYNFVENEVHATYAGFDLYDSCAGSTSVCPVSNATVRIADNHFFDNGIRIEATFGANVKCRVADNEFAHVGLELYLGPDTHDCVATDIRSFVDLGKNNHVSH